MPQSQISQGSPFRKRYPQNLFYSRKVDPDGTDKQRVLFFYGHRLSREKDQGWRFVFPLFFHGWDEKKEKDVWVFAGGFRAKKQETRTTMLGPVFVQHAPRARKTILFPFYFSASDEHAGTKNLTIGPYYSRQDSWGKRVGVVPFVFSARRGEYRSLAVFPFFYRERERDKQFLVTPLGFYRQESAIRGRGLIGPLYLSRSYDQSGPEATTALFPLFFHHREGEGKEKETWFLSLPGIYRHTWREEHPDGSPGLGSTLVTPLGFYHRSDAMGRRSGGFLNTYYTSTARGHRFGFVPLLFSSREGEKGSFALLPLLYHRHDQNNSVTLSPGFLDIRWPEDRPDFSAGEGRFTLALLGWRHHSDAREKTTFGLLSAFYTRAKGGWHAGLAPFLFAGDRRKSRYFHLFPVFFDVENRRYQSRTTFLGPFYKARRHETHFAGLAPFLYLRWGGEAGHYEDGSLYDDRRTSAVLFPLLFSGHDNSKDRSWFHLGPIFYRSQTGHSSAGVFPILFTGKNLFQDTNWFYLGPLYHFQRPHHRALGLFPVARLKTQTDTEGKLVRAQGSFLPLLFFAGKNHLADKGWLQLGPLFYRRHEENRALGLFPLAWSSKRKTPEGQYSSTALLPLFYSRKSPEAFLFLSLLSGHYHHYAREKRSRWIGPLFWHDDLARGISIRGVLPLFYDRWDEQKGARTTLLFPLSFQRESARGAFEMLFGLYWSSTAKDALGQVARDTRVLFPVFLRTVRPQEGRATTIFGPAFLHREPDGANGGVAPFWFFSDYGPYHRRIFLPVYWHSWDEDLGDHTAILGPLYSAERHGLDRKSIYKGFFPLIFYRKHFYGEETNTHLTVLPLFHQRETPHRRFELFSGLYWRDALKDETGHIVRDTRVLLPFFFQKTLPQEGRSTTVAGPFFFYKEPHGNSHGLAPFWFSARLGEYRHRVLFPIFWHFQDQKEGKSTTVFGPFYAAERSDAGYKSLYRGLVPLVFYRKHFDGETPTTKLTVFPLFGYGRGDGWRRFISPLGFYEKTPDSRRALFLSAFSWENPSTRGGGLLPFYFHQRNKNTGAQTRILLPLFAHHSRPVPDPYSAAPQSQLTGRFRVVGGLFWQGQNLKSNLEDAPRTRYTTLFPFYFHREDEVEGTRSTVVPPFFSRSFPGGKEAGLFPLLWFGERSRTIAYGNTLRTITWRHQVLFPLFWRFAEKERGGDSTTYAALLFWSKRRSGDLSGGVFPLVHFHNRAAEGGRDRGLSLFPLFGWRKHPQGGAFHSLLLSLYRDKEVSGGRALTVFWEKGPGSSRVAALPLFWFSKSEERRTSFSLLPLPYFRQSQEDGAQKSALFPLFYSWRTPGGERLRVLTPLAYYSRTPSEGRTGFYALPGVFFTKSPGEHGVGLWPLAQSFWRKTPEGEPRGFFYFFPALLYRRYDQGFSVTTPLMSYQRTGKERSLWALLYYGARNEETKSTRDVLFPLFYRQKNEESALTVAGPLYVGYRKGPLKVRVALPLVVDVATQAEDQRESRFQMFTPLYLHWKGKKAEQWRFGLLWSYTKHNRDYYLAQGSSEDSLTDWELKLSPLFKYIRYNDQAFYWKALLGAFGFERSGAARKVTIFWVPARLKDKPKR